MTWTLSSIARDPAYAESWRGQHKLFLDYMEGRWLKGTMSYSVPSACKLVEIADAVMERAWDGLCPQLREEIEKQEERYGILDLTSAGASAALAQAMMAATLSTIGISRGDQLLH